MGKQDRTLHTGLIAGVLAAHPGALTRGFMRTLRTMFPDDPEDEIRIVPDAFLVDAPAKRVTAFEVEVTSAMSPGKLDAYSSIAWWLDSECWTFEVVAVGRNGLAKNSDPLADELARVAALVETAGEGGV